MTHAYEWGQQIRRLYRLLPWSLHLLWQSHRGATVSLSFLTFAQSVIPAVQLWLTKLMIDQVVLIIGLPLTQRSGSPVHLLLLYVGLEASLLILGILIGLGSGHIRNILQEHLVYHVQLSVLTQSARLDLAAYESPDYYDQLRRAQQQAMYGPIQLLDALLTLMQTTLTLLSMVGLVLFYQPWIIPVLVLTTIPGFWAMMFYGQQRFILFNSRTPDGRRAEYLSTVLTSDTYAKELRVWGLAPYLLSQIEALRGRFRQENITLSRKQSVASFWGEMLSTSGYYAAYLSVLFSVIAGSLTLGDLTLYAGVFSRTQSLFENLLRTIANMYEVQMFAEQLAIFLALEPDITKPCQPQLIPSLQTGLTVQNLSFVYPGTDRVVLQDISFTIRTGECVALVGINGAGKTSLVKCLLRLYDPSDGAISIGCCDLRQLDPDEWRRQVGVVFQDYARYQLTARENIGFGCVDQLHDLAHIQQAAQKAEIDAVLQQLPQQYETLLGRQFEGGCELSLGQWQRIALARALLRNAPLLILDEPTAAMDAQVEYALYQQFREMTRERMTLLISHRFSTVRMADRILVLEDGKIIEEGNHEGLLAKNGRYAYLFGLQAEGYQTSIDANSHHTNGGYVQQRVLTTDSA